MVYSASNRQEAIDRFLQQNCSDAETFAPELNFGTNVKSETRSDSFIVGIITGLALAIFCKF